MLNEILSMGGYGIYVWPAYGITFFVFTINLIGALREQKHIRDVLQEVSGES